MVIAKYLKGIGVKDSHNVPQYKYITDKQGKLVPSIKVFKTENLNKENDSLNKLLGFTINIKQSNVNKKYSKYLNSKSIQAINKFYAKDFELLKYIKR
jgi:hypothetical protein